MQELLGSKTKEEILMYLGLRGGQSGRQIAKMLGKSPTQVFKALNQLQKAGCLIQSKWKNLSFYCLNPDYIYHDELISLIHKNSIHYQRKPFGLKIPSSRKIDVPSVLKLIELRGTNYKTDKLSDVLRKNYD